MVGKEYNACKCLNAEENLNTKWRREGGAGVPALRVKLYSWQEHSLNRYFLKERGNGILDKLEIRK